MNYNINLNELVNKFTKTDENTKYEKDLIDLIADNILPFKVLKKDKIDIESIDVVSQGRSLVLLLQVKGDISKIKYLDCFDDGKYFFNTTYNYIKEIYDANCTPSIKAFKNTPVG